MAFSQISDSQDAISVNPAVHAAGCVKTVVRARTYPVCSDSLGLVEIGADVIASEVGVDDDARGVDDVRGVDEESFVELSLALLDDVVQGESRPARHSVEKIESRSAMPGEGSS
jgi:hypothetical protein